MTWEDILKRKLARSGAKKDNERDFKLEDDLKNYSGNKENVEEYRQHIESTIQKMLEILKEYGAKMHDPYEYDFLSLPLKKVQNFKKWKEEWKELDMGGPGSILFGYPNYGKINTEIEVYLLDQQAKEALKHFREARLKLTQRGD